MLLTIVYFVDDFDKNKSQKQLKILSIKKQCDLVGKWNRCDLAEKHIFVARNRTELSNLQVCIIIYMNLHVDMFL